MIHEQQIVNLLVQISKTTKLSDGFDACLRETLENI